MKYGYAGVRSFSLPIAIGRQEHRTTKPPQMHFHNCYEVLLVTTGKYQLYAPQKLYEGEGACIVFFGRGVYHATVRMDCENTPFRCFDLYFLQSVLDLIPPFLLEISPLLDSNVQVLPLAGEAFDFLLPKFEEMRKVYARTYESGKTPPVLYGLLLTALNYLADMVRTDKGYRFDVGADSDFYITKVTKSIIEAIDHGDDISVSELAARYYVGVTKLSTDFHRLIGLSIKQLICQLRLERAKSLLKSGMDVRTVGQRCGFSSDSYFVQFFKRYTGMSPGKYRDQAAQDEA